VDLWNEQVQEAVLGLLGTVLTIVLAWLAAKAAGYLRALETKALESAGEIAEGRFVSACEKAIRYVEQWAARKINITSAEKLAAARALVGKWFPEADPDDIEAMIEATLNGLKTGWDTITPRSGTSYSAPAPDPLADLHAKIESARTEADAKIQEVKRMVTMGGAGGGA